MNTHIKELFTDKKLIRKIQSKLPQLFHIAEQESSRAGKIGMEVGSVREKIIIALLMYKFGEKNVNTDIPITEAEVDVLLYNKPVSIKTITGKSPKGVKLIWTVDADKSKEFAEKYKPSCDMILIQINSNNGGGFYFISKEIQSKIFSKLDRDIYLKLPKAGTNPRGVEITGIALKELIEHKNSLSILIDWKKEVIDYKPYQRWLDLWQQD